MGWGTSRPDAGGETESLAAIAGPISVGRGDRAEAGANLCPGQPAPQPESGAGDVGAGDLESWPTKRLWKRRAGEKSNSRLSPRACKSRKKRAIRTFPQPRRRPFSGYIFHVSTAQPKVTFTNGLTRSTYSSSSHPEWKPYFTSGKKVIGYYADLLSITPAERRRPALIPYWKHAFELKDERTKSRPFLRWLDKWLYGDTSAQAHLNFGGLLSVAPMLVAELVGGQTQEMAEERMLVQYKFQQFSRTALVVLAIATEIDNYYNLGNRGQAGYVWKMFVEHVPEGREMFEARYADLVSRKP